MPSVSVLVSYVSYCLVAAKACPSAHNAMYKKHPLPCTRYKKIYCSVCISPFMPLSYLARSDPGDVARVEGETYICTEKEEDVIAEGAQRLPAAKREGPNWMPEKTMDLKMKSRLGGSMKGAEAVYLHPISVDPRQVYSCSSKFVEKDVSYLNRLGLNFEYCW